MKTHTALMVGGLVVIILGTLVWSAVGRGWKIDTGTTISFADCVAAGFPVLESYPRQCRDGAGVMHVEVSEASVDVPPFADPSTFVTTRENPDIIRLKSPLPGEVISSPLTITGEARGNWFFEATFPIVITDWDGRIIAEGYAEAEGEWMTTDFVPFRGTLEFASPEDIGPFSRRGALILQKSNASGLPEHDDALEIVIGYPTAS